MKIKDIKNKLKGKKKKKKLTGKDYLSTGSTLLNLACTGKPYRGFAKGKYYFVVGDSSSGKTFLLLTCLAEAGIDINFKNYRFIYDNSEDGALMDIEKFFGKAVAQRMEAPSYNKKESVYSTTIEEFYYHVDDAIKIGTPFIYIQDSMDSLSSSAEQEKFEKTKKADRKGKSITGSFGDGKAKKNSSNLRRLLTPLRKSKSILIVISQTRDNLGFGFEKKTRSGGHALRFYATLEIWSSIKKRITVTIKDKKRQIGIICQCRVKKNRITGKDKTIDIPIYPSFGFDNTGSCVDYLIDEKHWKQSKGSLVAPEFDFRGSRKKLIKYIEDEDMEKDLISIVTDCWNEIEDACSIKRKKRY